MWQVIQSIFKYKLLKTSELTQKDIELAIIKQTISHLKKNHAMRKWCMWLITLNDDSIN